MGIGFQIIDGVGRFSVDCLFHQAEKRLDDVLDQHSAGMLSDPAYIAELKAIITDSPEYIDGHAHLGHALLASGKTRAALSSYEFGIALGETAIPVDFSGTLSWYELDNRPFLRALHGAALAQLRLKKRKAGISLMERMLSLNPDDNQSVRYLLGSEYMRNREPEKASFLLESWAEHYPPCAYDLGLLRFKQNKFVAAATQLRRAFTANFYIAEILCGHPDPAPLSIWHDSNYAMPELARHYAQDYGKLWHDTCDALPFLHWLYHHPKVLLERADVLDCREQLEWEHSVERRQKILYREQEFLAQIDDRISEEIVTLRSARDGRPVYPWWRL
ncbi:hypothetical protein sphantq_00406 [Sphingobium sp. AntQ-1]|uniref:tetratricopeptide repeat protein n=1 Tax=Sphingobium sp. AntQ-1 TaxID=2930091 RepID=UPI00234E7FE3|nr:hypothetical protein [Sphingobium sp. AntQ-1]WCP12009.1 hypothetical protein sphantq_00406 [Sphingobium sp. AntQ-1]